MKTMKMTMTPIREKLGELPLWAQVSIASRSVRRAVLAAAPDNEKRLLVRALDAMDCCVEYGSWEPREERALQAVAPVETVASLETVPCATPPSGPWTPAWLQSPPMIFLPTVL